MGNEEQNTPTNGAGSPLPAQEGHRFWIGAQPNPDDRLQIVVSDFDYNMLANQPTSKRRGTVTDLLTGNQITVQAADCGAGCKCALEVVEAARPLPASGKATLYQRLVAVMKPEDISNHYSDLYVRYTPEAAAIIDQYRKENGLTAGWGLCSFFTNQVEGGRWIDIPLAYDPYWEAELRRTARL